MAALTGIVHGKAGSIAWAGTETAMEEGVLSFVLEITNDVIDTTSMDDATYHSRTVGWYDWTATVEVEDTGFTIANVGETAALSLIETVGANSNTYSGTAFLQSVAYTTDVNDVVKTVYTFAGSGAVAKS